MIQASEKAKAAFLTVENDGEYWAFSLARLEPQVLDIAVQEMLLEPVRDIVDED